MALTLVASGTDTAVVGTEQTLYSTTSTAIYIAVVDLTNMQSGDTVELRIKTKVLSGSPTSGGYFQSFSGAQNVDNLVQFSVPVPSDQSFIFTLKQTAGTARNFDWKVFTL